MAIARAVLGRPAIVFADEPTGTSTPTRATRSSSCCASSTPTARRSSSSPTTSRSPKRCPGRWRYATASSPWTAGTLYERGGGQPDPPRRRLRVGTVAFRTRRMRACISPSRSRNRMHRMVVVLGVSLSSEVQPDLALDRPPTAASGVVWWARDFSCRRRLSTTAPSMIGRDRPRQQRLGGDPGDGQRVPHRLIPTGQSGGISVVSVDPSAHRGFLAGTLSTGVSPNAATARYRSPCSARPPPPASASTAPACSFGPAGSGSPSRHPRTARARRPISTRPL